MEQIFIGGKHVETTFTTDAKISPKNSEGYIDPTAQKGLQSVQDEQDEADRRAKRLIMAIRTIVDEAGYDLLARIEIHDRTTGRNYR